MGLGEMETPFLKGAHRLSCALGPSACEILCSPFKNGVSVSPSPVELLCTSPTGLQCQMFQGLFLPLPDPHT